MLDITIGSQFQDRYTGEIVEVIAIVAIGFTLSSGETVTRESLNIHWDEVSRPRMTLAHAARITHDARIATAPHLTFAEQVDAGHPDPMPCACWYAGNGNIRGLRRDAVTHPAAFAEGAECAYERAYDI